MDRFHEKRNPPEAADVTALLEAAYEKKFAEDTTEEKTRDKKLATIVEAIFYDQASRNGWLGPEAQVLRSSTNFIFRRNR